jgi:dolichyl-phosphate-mannose--protein O-mannosyl transferase
MSYCVVGDVGGLMSYCVVCVVLYLYGYLPLVVSSV